MAQKSQLSDSSKSFHDMIQKVYEENKNKTETRKIEKNYDDHIEDFFHPDNIFNKSRNFPTIGNVNAARGAAERTITGSLGDLTDESSHLKAAKLLFLSQTNAFQHRILMRLGNKLMKGTENETSEETITSRNNMVFESFDKTTVLEKSGVLPANWSIVQISSHDFLVSRFRPMKAAQPLSSNPGLTMVRLCGGRVRVSRCEPPPSSRSCSAYLQECNEIKEKSVAVVRQYSSAVKNDDKNKSKATSRADYLTTRYNLEERLKTLVQSMEDSWLGSEKASLLGTLVSSEDGEKVRSVVRDSVTSDLGEAQGAYLHHLLSAVPFLSDKQLVQGMRKNLPHLEEEEIKRIVKTARVSLAGLSECRRHPVILILDSEIQSLPWESLPSLRTCRQAVSRVPSLPFLYCLWAAHSDNDGSVVTSGLAQDNVYYVLNPDKSLKNTEEKIKSVLRQETYSNWEGVVGEIPEKQQLTRALQEKVSRCLIQTSSLLLICSDWLININ